METVKVGVVGVGSLGQHHARNYKEIPGCELVGVADVDHRAATRVASKCQCQAFFDYETLLGKVDAVSVVVPTSMHYEIAREFLSNGVDVLVEKPITHSLGEATALIELAKEKGRTLQVGHIERFNAAVQYLQKILTRPAFIECHRLGPFDPRVRDVGVVLDLMIHDIDILLQIVDSPIRSVDAVGVPILSNREDIANARITFENGCIANLTVSRVTPNKMRKIRIFQPDTYISLDYQGQNLEIYHRESIEGADEGEPKAQIVRKKIKLKKEEPLRAELMHFTECVREGHTPKVTGEHGHDALELAVSITRQLEDNLGQISELIGT